MMPKPWDIVGLPSVIPAPTKKCKVCDNPAVSLYEDFCSGYCAEEYYGEDFRMEAKRDYMMARNGQEYYGEDCYES